MNKLISVLLAGVLALHGLIHLLGAVAYLRIAEVQGLLYKTTVFEGRWNLGETGTLVFGLLWGLAASGFVIAAVGMLTKWAWWKPLLLASTLLSLALGAMDWEVAKVGLMVNGAILLGLWGLVMTSPPRAAQVVER